MAAPDVPDIPDRARRCAPGPRTIALVVDGPIDQAAVGSLCARVRSLLSRADVDVVTCEVGGLVEPDVGVVDALARLQLTARRQGRSIRLLHVGEALRDLLFMTGLGDVLGLCPGSVRAFEGGAMTPIESPIEVVREIYAAMAERDFDRLFELIDPTCVVTQDPALPWGGRHVGHEGFATFGLALSGAIDSAVTIEAIFEADGDVIQFGRTRGTTRTTGTAFDIPEVHRWTIRDGRAVTAQFSIDTAAMLRALATRVGDATG